MTISKIKFPLFFTLQLTLLWGFFGCGAVLKKTAVGSFIEDVANATAKHDDIVLVAQASPTYLLLLEGLLQSSPNDPDLLISAAQFYTSYGALVEPDDPVRARRIYQRAKEFGIKALMQNRHIAPLIRAPYPVFEQITHHLKPEDITLIFWAASSWGAWIGASTESVTALADLPKVIHMMEWVINEKESFFYGSPHVFLGMYHAALPQGLGGNPQKALFHFNRALEINRNQSLMVYVQMARFYARQTFDRPLYDSLLQTVLAKPIDEIPELTLQNATAQKMARKLLAEADDFF